MRLISLTANKPSFRKVDFNRTGPSLIVGKQKRSEEGKSEGEEKTDEEARTYNGVGKSLLLYLVNYCLGSETKRQFVEKLAGWEFTLRVDLGGKEVPIIRRTNETDLIQLGAEKLKLSEFRDRLQMEVFPGIEDLKFLTFRSLMGLFLRPGKTAYDRWDGIQYSEKEVQRMLRAAHLLGLDTKLAIEKYDLVVALKEIDDMSRRFEKDPILKEYFEGKKDVDLDIQGLQETHTELDANLRNFKVAENYHEIEREVASLKAEVQKLRNSIGTQEQRLRHIDESLKTKPGISLDAVREAYAQVQVEFPPNLMKSLVEVEAFHSQLLSVRTSRLQREKKNVEGQLARLRTTLSNLSTRMDTQLKFLGDHGALGELLALKDKANEIGNRLQKLLDYKRLKKQYKDRSNELKAELAKSNVESQRYLNESEALIAEACNLFRSFTRRMYPDKQSGITVENDDGVGQCRFHIEVKIHDDASDGINEVKIFSYDMTIASLRRNHDVRFLCHDSRLFADIDPRQRASLFQIACEVSNEKDFQYIGTVNEDQIDILKRHMGAEKFKECIDKCVVLELNDDSPEGKLLGIDVDLDYD